MVKAFHTLVSPVSTSGDKSSLKAIKSLNNSIIIRNNDTEVSSSSSELQVAKSEEKFHNWSIPFISKNEVYKSQAF
ncbi:hypothetical protein AHAS_Ahas02G0123600 [Arachis hypogaea]